MSQILMPQSLSGIQRGYDEAELLQYNVQYIPSFLIKKAIEFGFIIPGWDLTDYILAAIKGDPNESIKRLGFVSVGMWGELGSGKSNLSMQLAYAVHHDWDIVLDRVILMREDLVKTYRAVMNVDYRIPIAIIDDVTTLLPRSLWQQDRELYTVFNKFLAVIRPKIACMISTVPDISWMLETMTEVMNFEVCVTPNQRFLVQRFYKETDPQKQASVNFMKILVEYADFDLENVPGDVWAEYQDRRQRLVDEVVKQLEKKLGSPKAAERVEIGSAGILAEPLGDKGIKYILGDDADRYAIKCVKCGHITSVEKDRKNKYVRCWGCKTVIDCRFGG